MHSNSHGHERRRHARTQMNLTVRFLLHDGTEHSGTVTNISVGGMAITSSAKPAAGSIVIAYVQDLGRLEGLVSRTEGDGFAVRLTLSALRREKLEERLGVGFKPAGIEGRRHDRESTEGVSKVVRSDGREVACKVIDLSLGGVSVAAAERRPLGEQVLVGKMRGRVVRHHDRGFAIEFTEIPPSRGSLAEQLISDRTVAA
jgi:PilZ domain